MDMRPMDNPRMLNIDPRSLILFWWAGLQSLLIISHPVTRSHVITQLMILISMVCNCQDKKGIKYLPSFTWMSSVRAFYGGSEGGTDYWHLELARDGRIHSWPHSCGIRHRFQWSLYGWRVSPLWGKHETREGWSICHTTVPEMSRLQVLSDSMLNEMTWDYSVFCLGRTLPRGDVDNWLHADVAQHGTKLILQITRDCVGCWIVVVMHQEAASFMVSPYVST